MPDRGSVLCKAVRPDLTSFQGNPPHQYIVGEWTPPLTRLVICERGYHVSDVAAETMVGGKWPARLFVAEAKRLSKTQSWKGDHTHKGVAGSIRIVDELPAWQVFGPNGKAVVRLIEQAGAVTADQAAKLDAARYAARGAARGAAWDAAWDVARDAARAAAWAAAWYAARDVAAALVVADLITSEQFEVLAGPWISVMGDPR